MLPFLLTSLVFAADPVGPPNTDIAEMKPASRGKQQGRRGKKKGKTQWKNRFYARPLVAGSSFTNANGETTLAAGIGGEGGVRYWEAQRALPRLRGRTRATVQYLVSTNAEGMEVKLGSFMGPAWEYFALESGLDVSWDRYEWDGVPMAASVGYGVPFIATAGVSIITIYAGFQPTFMSNETRRVDWAQTDEFGFGHQFSTFSGVSLAIDDMNIGLGYTRTVSAAGGIPGLQEGYGLTLSFRG
jgi:hypothetical protein